jgi:hypothetical protein
MLARRPSFAILLAASLCAGIPAAAGSAAIADGPPVEPVDPQIAAAVASVSATQLKADDTRLVGFGTRNTFSETSTDPHRGVYAARAWLASRFRAIGKAAGGRLRVTYDTYVQPKTDRTPRDVEVSSVIATLPGDDPARGVIVISSHYDSRNSDGNDATLDAPGADDNGSATSAVLEAARVLTPLHFPATLVFACFDGEEQGLFGSGHYAHELAKRGVKVEADLNNDIIGSSTAHDGTRVTDEVRLFSESIPAGASPGRINALGSENDSPGRELARTVRDIDTAYEPTMRVRLIWRADRFLRGGDQESFSAEGFPAVRFVESHENFDHQHQTIRTEGAIRYGDLLEFVDFDYLARVTQLNVAAMGTLARAPRAPEAFLLNRDLGYSTTLRWNAVPGASSYEIVYRETTDPTWTHSRNVGDVGTITLEGLSKDDYIFGVRALDSSGRGSVATYPLAIK